MDPSLATQTPSDPMAVAVVDGNASRRDRVCAAARDAGCQPETGADPHNRYYPIALIGTGDRLLEPVTSWTAAGSHVICYSDGPADWPLADRCRLLLAGAVDTVTPGEQFIHRLAAALHRACQTIRGRADADRALKAQMGEAGIVGDSRSMLAVFRDVRQVSVLSDLPTLITGETGTGKQLIAKALHDFDSKRRRGPFVPVNCAAIATTVAESELFGHRRGAFTGADRDRRGLIRAADGGVLFLDEIGELDAGMQAKLLRVVQDQVVLPVGDERETPVSVRLIAATNRDLRQMVAAGTFREDLFHRINVLKIHVPPLRERRADIASLIAHFVAKHQPDEPAAVDAEVVDALSSLALPGNARELENLVRRALLHAAGAPLTVRDLPADVWSSLSETRPTTAASVHDEPAFAEQLLDAHPGNLASALDACERVLISAAFERAQGNQARTARMLGVTPRCIYNKLRKHRLTA